MRTTKQRPLSARIVRSRRACPHWVIRVGLAGRRRLPHYPYKQTSLPCVGMFQVGQSDDCSGDSSTGKRFIHYFLEGGFDPTTRISVLHGDFSAASARHEESIEPHTTAKLAAARSFRLRRSGIQECPRKSTARSPAATIASQISETMKEAKCQSTSRRLDCIVSPSGDCAPAQRLLSSLPLGVPSPPSLP